MKKSFLLQCLLVLTGSVLIGQNNVQLTINHKLGENDFELLAPSKNNMGHDFKVDRLQYYISEMSIIDDAGNEIFIDDLWILVNADQVTNVDLGNHNISNVESIRFGIGVNEEVNHGDPSLYPSSHPLAPQSPSMHWGWASGYRFIALEGNGGSNYNQLFQLHGLGDSNYSIREVTVPSKEENGQINIEIDADYTKLLDNISVNSGVIVHGENLQAKTCLQNFKFVFKPTDLTSSYEDFVDFESFNAFPNPIKNGVLKIDYQLKNADLKYQVSLSDIHGRQLQSFGLQNSQLNFDFDNYLPGVYILNILKEGQVVLTKKIIRI
ncbi:MAG: T9SS type A sorting domain-containing protein [Saprospiraceae bacterium]|nr:T9SS type A sorting domain-containing protein [Saprospiraceae bacterium]